MIQWGEQNGQKWLRRGVRGWSSVAWEGLGSGWPRPAAGRVARSSTRSSGLMGVSSPFGAGPSGGEAPGRRGLGSRVAPVAHTRLPWSRAGSDHCYNLQSKEPGRHSTPSLSCHGRSGPWQNSIEPPSLTRPVLNGTQRDALWGRRDPTASHALAPHCTRCSAGPPARTLAPQPTALVNSSLCGACRFLCATRRRAREKF